MHIGFLTPEYPHITPVYGGIATSIATLSHGLTKRGHKVTVFLYGRETDEVFYDEQVKIVALKMKRKKGLTWWTNRKYIESVINSEVVHNGLSLVEAPDWTGITAFMNLQCPLLIRLHGSDTYFCHIEKRHQKYKNYFFEKAALKQADHIVSVSDYTAHLTKKLFALKKEIKIIHNGIDTASFIAKTSSDTMDPYSILYLGTLIRKKGVLELAAIFNEVIKKQPNAKLHLVGADAPDIVTGSRSTWQLMQNILTKEAQRNVTYFGKIPHQKIQHFINQASVCVFPSFAEAFPISWLEAMACTKPIVASNIGWAKECIIDGESGYLVDPTDHETYAHRILYLFDNPQEANILGENARKHVKKYFDISIIIEENLAYYQSIQHGDKQ